MFFFLYIVKHLLYDKTTIGKEKLIRQTYSFFYSQFYELPIHGFLIKNWISSFVPNYFKNYEVPIICYKYNKPIRGAIFNFNKLVSDLDIETCNPDS